MKNSFFCFLAPEGFACKLWVSVWASLEATFSWAVWGVKEKAECVDVVLDVESRLGIDVHGDDAAIVKPQLQKLQCYKGCEAKDKNQ
jgi:hypothetical protein